MARRTGRPRVGEEALTRERILDAALSIADAHGIGALSMRRLAGELGVDPMAIYHHLPGKEAVVSGVVERVFAGMRVPDAEGKGWQERVRDFARAYRDLARSHPNLVREIVAGAASSGTIETSEPLYAALEAAGFPPATVARAADAVVDYVNGFALAEAGGPLGGTGDRRGLLELLEDRPEGGVPAMRRVFGALSEEEMPADFEFGLNVVVSGVEAVAARRERNTSNTDGA